MLLKTTMVYQWQYEHYIYVCYFLSWSFSALTHFIILCSGYRLAEDIQQITVRHIFPKIHRYKIGVYKLVGTLFTNFHVFFFQLIFVLPARYKRMRNFSGKSKQTQVVYTVNCSEYFLFVIYLLMSYSPF